MEKIKEPLIFLAGAAIGSVTTWLIVRKKYKEKAQQEIDSVTEVYAKLNRNKPDISTYTAVIEEARKKQQETQEIVEETQRIQQDIEEELELLEKPRTINYSGIYETPTVAPEEKKIEEKSKTRAKDDDEDFIYEISINDFSKDLNDHSKITITRFEDDVFTDEMYNRIDPRECLNHRLVLLNSSDIVDPIDYIRRMPKDEICIRNYELKMDINVAAEPRTYADFMSI